MSDYDPVIDAEIAILRAEVAKLKVDNAEWLRMSQRKDRIIDELRAEKARLEADLLDEQLRHGQTAKVAREEVARLKAERDVQGR